MPYSPPFKLTPLMLSQVAEICGIVGRLDGASSDTTKTWGASSPYLRKDNRIRSIHSSLAIENNSLSLDQVTDVIDGKRVLGLEREVQEVRNAFNAYQTLSDWIPTSPTDLLTAHGMMMKDIDPKAGRYRSKGVGIYRGTQLVHMAPPADRVPYLIDQLFSWLSDTETHPIVASAVVHYELEFIHPFSDGNGRIGRLWQTLILAQWNPNLAYLPVETVIHKEQQDYYQALGKADTIAEATPFIDFMLSAIITALRHKETASQIQTDPVIDPVIDPVSKQVRKLLIHLNETEESNTEKLMLALKIKHRPTFRANYINPALKQKLIHLTQPDTPNSPTQTYRLTNQGKSLIPNP